MQQDFFAQLRKAISHERLEAYQARSNASDALTLAAHYARNIALSESLYPSLQAIAIALRNSIHDAIGAHCDSEEWYAPHCQLLLVEVIGWINPAMKSFILGFDRFTQVETRLLDDYQDTVSSISRDGAT